MSDTIKSDASNDAFQCVIQMRGNKIIDKNVAKRLIDIRNSYVKNYARRKFRTITVLIIQFFL